MNVILRVRLKKDWKWQDYTRWRKVKNDVSIVLFMLSVRLYINDGRLIVIVGDPENNRCDGHPDRTLPELHPLDGQRGHRRYVEEKGAVELCLCLGNKLVIKCTGNLLSGPKMARTFGHIQWTPRRI